MPLVRHNADHVIYARPPVVLVICQLSFEPILRLASAPAVAPFQEFVRSEYPALTKVGAITLTLGPKGLDAENAEAAGGWSFSSSDGLTQIVISPDSLVLQTRAHRSFTDLRVEFERILEFFCAEYEPGARARLGLRYINRISSDAARSLADWRALVKPELFGIAATDHLAMDNVVRHSFGQARLAHDDSQMIVRYGLLEAGTISHPEVQPAAVPSFLLDIDHFDVRRFDELSVAQVMSQLDSFHDDIYAVFDWCLTERGHSVLTLAGDESEGRVHAG